MKTKETCMYTMETVTIHGPFTDWVNQFSVRFLSEIELYVHIMHCRSE